MDCQCYEYFSALLIYYDLLHSYYDSSVLVIVLSCQIDIVHSVKFYICFLCAQLFNDNVGKFMYKT